MVASYLPRDGSIHQAMSPLQTVCYTTKRTNDFLSIAILPVGKIGADLFELDKTSYLIVVDYFLQFPKVIRLKSTTSKSVITALKSIFSHYADESI